MRSYHTILLLVLFSASLTLSGCVGIRVGRSGGPAPRASSTESAAESSERCPPGHQWSEGKCHDKGKGHDADKHHGKAKGHDKDKAKGKAKGHDKDEDEDDDDDDRGKGKGKKRKE